MFYVTIILTDKNFVIIHKTFDNTLDIDTHINCAVALHILPICIAGMKL